MRQHIDAYFEYIYPVPLYSFLHRADFLNRYTKGETTPALLLAVCAVSSRFLHDAAQAARQGKSWIEKAERMLFQNLGRTTLENLQAQVLVGLYHNYNFNFNKSFIYVALAVRMAYALKLHKEDRQFSFVDQECRRRLMWCLFINDRFQAGGVPVSYVLAFLFLDVSGAAKRLFVITLRCSKPGDSLDLPMPSLEVQGAIHWPVSCCYKGQAVRE